MIRLINYTLLPFRLIFLAAVLLGIGMPFIIILYFKGPYKAYNILRLPTAWGKWTCFFLGIRLKVEGLENVPREKGVVFLFSHASFADIPILFAALPRFFNFAAKSYVFKYPIFGPIGRMYKTLEIFKDREKSIEQYKKAEERLQYGESFMVAPEGTRSDGEEINEFKSGPFIFAMNAKADLVPVLIYGASYVWPKKDAVPNLRCFGGNVVLKFLEPVSTIDFTNENRKEKAASIRTAMISELDKLKSLRK